MATHKNVLALTAVAALFTGVAQADSWSISAMALAVETDTARLADAGADGGTGFEIIGRNAVTNSSGYQLVYSGWNLDVNANGSKGTDAFGANYIYGKLTGKAQAYLLAGIGFSRVDVAGGEKDTHEHLNLGIGGELSVSEKWGVTSEVKWRRTFDDTSLANENKYGDWSLGLGAAYRF